MDDYKNKLLLNNLKRLYNVDINDSQLVEIIQDIDLGLSKQKKCKVCNKKYKGNNRYYGTSCIKNLYNNAHIEYFKDVDDKELFLHSAIILKLNKSNLSKKQINNVVDSYLEKLYFEKLNIETKIIKELENVINKTTKKIMELNTAYRIYKILKNNPKVINLLLNSIDKDMLDKKIDEEVLKFFRTYFRMVKTTDVTKYEVYYFVQFLFWELVVRVGDSLNLSFSSRCLSHSLSIKNKKTKNVEITDKDKNVISLIKEDNEFKKKLKLIIKKYGKEESILINRNNVDSKEDFDYSFSGGDLFYSLHSVQILAVDGIKIDNLWNLNIILTDRYDFTEILLNDKYNKKGDNYITKGNILNDFAAISSQYGVIKSYDITIKFNWSDFDEEN